MANNDYLTRLQQLLDEAKALITVLQPPALSPEGWSLVQPNGKPPTGPFDTYARNGCTWNTQESRDLVKSWMGFTSVDVMAGKHKRTQGAIRSQLQHLLYAANVEVILDELVPKD